VRRRWWCMKWWCSIIALLPDAGLPKNLWTLEKKINVRRRWWRSIVITTSNAWLTKKESVNNFKKDQCPESAEVLKWFNVRRRWWRMKWRRSIVITPLPDAGLQKKSANVGKKINVRRRWWHSIIVAASKHAAYQKKNLQTILKKINVPNLWKFNKHSMWGDGGGTWSGGASSHQMWLPEKNLPMLEKISMWGGGGGTASSSLLPNARLTKKRICEQFKKRSMSQICESLKNVQCEEMVVAHEVVVPCRTWLPEKNLQMLEKRSMWGGSGGAASSSHHFQMRSLPKRICKHLKKLMWRGGGGASGQVAYWKRIIVIACTANVLSTMWGGSVVAPENFTCGWLPKKSAKKESIITINIMCHGATQGGEVHKVIVCKNVFFQCMKW